ncbi:hypothetical protein EV643_102456 [Kribbella sp. VKM Ac-2527]|uniref:Uncharacterized protein n=1 Tax=Kribbella caucasensis TaxID=2512215 RepID=A0A4R6KM21_9ACTN|nr:hypothetical protein [Kribbella sp. VKM Ac-2527]TDO52617.1 hypothetical protein EV643_102456 [Kribbella sp. VKM Ac-2527]
MLPDTRESRPDGDQAASRSDGEKLKSTLTPLGGLDAVAAAVDGAFVVVVETTGGKYRRRCFLTAASAERAAGRATERGENATVYLAELKPLWKLRGGVG